MSEVRLVEVTDDLQIYSTSTVDARFLYREIFTFNGYGDFALPPNALVIDVGANIGMFLLWVKTLHSDAEVWAFEPMPALAEAVRRNIEYFGFTEVRCHEVALGEATRAEVPFTFYPLLPSSSTRYPQRQERLKEVMGRSFPPRVLERMYAGQTVFRDLRRLSEYLSTDRVVDLLKVDTSGSELEVLAGIDAGHWPRIRNVVLDIQDQDGRIGAATELLTLRGLRPTLRPAPMAGEDGLNFQLHASRSDH